MNNIITEDAAARKIYDDLWRACAAALAQGDAQIDPHLRDRAHERDAHRRLRLTGKHRLRERAA